MQLADRPCLTCYHVLHSLLQVDCVLPTLPIHLILGKTSLLVQSAASKSPLLFVCPTQEDNMTLMQRCSGLLIEETAEMLLQYILQQD